MMTKMNCDIEPGVLYTYGLKGEGENTQFSAYDGRVRMRVVISEGSHISSSSIGMAYVMRALKTKHELSHTYVGHDANVVWGS